MVGCEFWLLLAHNHANPPTPVFRQAHANHFDLRRPRVPAKCPSPGENAAREQPNKPVVALLEFRRQGNNRSCETRQAPNGGAPVASNPQPVKEDGFARWLLIPEWPGGLLA